MIFQKVFERDSFLRWSDTSTEHKIVEKLEGNFENAFYNFQIRYNFSCLQCPTVLNENSNGALPKPEPLSALNVSFLDFVQPPVFE